MSPETEARFWSKVDKSGECWLWMGSRDGKGYGAAPWGGKQRRAHRIAYELVKGPIPDGLVIDHLCRNPSCVNPDHLEAVTPAENNIRGFSVTAQNARATHCKYGHPFDEANTGYNKKGRICKACQERLLKEYRDRKREKRKRQGEASIAETLRLTDGMTNVELRAELIVRELRDAGYSIEKVNPKDGRHLRRLKVVS